MPCTCPVEIWPARPGAANKRPVYSPQQSYHGAKSTLRPCGQCTSCRIEKAQQLLTSRTLPEARVAMRELITAGLLDVQVIDLPAGDQSVEIFPTPLALATMEPPAIQWPQ